jgi:hypothetical protein
LYTFERADEPGSFSFALRDALEEFFPILIIYESRPNVTLKKYRTGGEQKVTVQHVTVSDNAQAIVGNVSAGGGDDKKK